MNSIFFLPSQKSDVTGTTGDDVFVCDSGTFIPQGGGAYSAGHLNGGYHIAGGDGFDTIDFNADTSLTFGRATISGIEECYLDTDARIGAGPGHAYAFTMQNANVAPGHSLFIDGVYSTSFFFDGSAETNGTYDVVGGRGENIFLGGAGADEFMLQHGGGSVDAGGGDDLILAGGRRDIKGTDPAFADGSLKGGSGVDTLWLNWAHLHMHAFNAASSGLENLEGTPDITGDKHANALDFSGFAVLTPDNLLTANGGDGNDTLTGWSADNMLLGGAGDDWLIGGDARNVFKGGAGADHIGAGAGEDIVRYDRASESSGTQIDTIDHFDFATDRFDVRRLVSMATTAGPGQPTGDAVLFTPDPSHPEVMELTIDQNGKFGYQPGEDLLIHLIDPLHTDHFGTADFI